MKADRPRGFILPTSLLVLTLLTVMLTAAFVLISAEFRSTDNANSGTRALALSQAAMQTYFGSNHLLKPTDWGDSIRYTYSNGYADVVARKIVMATSGSTSWVVRSTGTTTDPLLSGQVTAKRTIGQMAALNPASISPRAAMFAINGVSYLGGGNPIDGSNSSPANVAGCVPSGVTDTNGVATVTGRYSGTAPTGGLENWATQAVAYDSTHVDWPAVLTGNFTPDYVSAAGLPSPGNTDWEVGYINGNLTIPSSGGQVPANLPRQGVLVVTGDVTMASDANWAGLIIAGGRLITPLLGGNYYVRGYVVTGLNCVTGGACVANQVALNLNNPGIGFYHVIRWNWCYANLAIQSLSALVPVKNSFIDNWAAY